MVSGAGAVGLACAEPSASGPVIGLALGSGAARGWAHLGVLQELAREGVVPQIITGCSIGAFVGAAAASGDLDKLVRWAETLKWQDVVSLLDVSLRGGLIKGQKLIDFFERNFIDRDFTELDRRFACVATELSTGREIWLHEGSVSAAVRASIALPGLMTPVLHQGRMLVDEVDEEGALARSPGDAPEVDGLVIIPDGEGLAPGDFVRVRITDCDVHDLYAERIE